MAKPSTAILPGHRVVRAIGSIVLRWNALEMEVRRFIEFYINDRDLAILITTPLGNQSLSDLVSGIVRLKELDKRVVDRVEHGLRAFHICRENRNTLIHALAMGVDARARFAFGRRSKSKPENWLSYRVRLSQLWQLDREMFITLAHFHNLHQYLMVQSAFPKGSPLPPLWQRRPSLPRKFALPKICPPLPPEAPPKPKSPPRSSRE